MSSRLSRRFLRRPRGAGELAADALRVLGVASVVVAAVALSPTDAGVLAFVLLGLMIPRFLGVRALVDVASSVALLVAGWSSVVDLYRSIAWWDLAVHFAANAATAALAVLLLARVGAIEAPEHAPRWVVVFLCAVTGLAGGAVWELLEWAGHTYLDDAIFVGYDDTIGDMALGGLGAVAAGLVLSALTWTLHPDAEPDPEPVPAPA